MTRNGSSTPASYIAGQPPARRNELRKVRRVIRANLPKGYREAVNWGVITYEVPLKKYPDTYNGKPLCYAALASQKHHIGLYLMNVYGDSKLRKALEEGFRKAGKPLNMGQACVRFQQADDLALEVIGELIAAVPVTRYIEQARAGRRR